VIGSSEKCRFCCKIRRDRTAELKNATIESEGMDFLINVACQQLVLNHYFSLGGQKSFCNKICQQATYAPQKIAVLLDHLVGAGERGRWHVEAEGFSDLEIDPPTRIWSALAPEGRPASSP
jgi:hypothetical protein